MRERIAARSLRLRTSGHEEKGRERSEESGDSVEAVAGAGGLAGWGSAADFLREKRRLRRPWGFGEGLEAAFGSAGRRKTRAVERAASDSFGERISSAPGWAMMASWRAHHLGRLLPEAVRAGKERAMAEEGSSPAEARAGRRAAMEAEPLGCSRSIWRSPQQEAR